MLAGPIEHDEFVHVRPRSIVQDGMGTRASLFETGGAYAGTGSDSSLLWSLGVSGHVLAPNIEPRDVRFVLDLRAQSDPGQVPFSFVSPYVSDGESMVVDFHAGNSPGFKGFAELLTNGEPNLMSFLWRWRDNACSLTCPEGGLIGEFDLAGRDVNLVRLLVDDIRIGPIDEADPDEFRLTFAVTYEFYGTVVPEPGCGILIAFGVVMLLFRRRRTAFSTV